MTQDNTCLIRDIVDRAFTEGHLDDVEGRFTR